MNGSFEAEVYSAFMETIRRRLKAKVLEAIDKDVDAVVAEAVDSLKATMKFYEDVYMGCGMIEVILKKE